MQNKKGLSDVVTTVLIVLLTIVAIGILWSFLQPLFTSSGEKLQQTSSCLYANLEVTACSTSGNVTVKRNAGASNIQEVKLIYEKPDGSTEVKNSTSVPQELGTSVYTNTFSFQVKSVSVSPGIADSKGKISYCNPTQPVACR